MTGKAYRPLAVLLVAELAMGAALLVWALQGFPLPTAITGPHDAATSSRTPSSKPRPVAPAAGVATTASDDATVVPTPTVDRFDGKRAFALLRKEVLRYGWRPAGSTSLRRLAVHLRGLLPDGHFESIPGHPKLRNVVGSIPGHGKALVIGAHYDVESHPKGFVGANDGAAGTAAAVWLARALARAPRTRDDRPIQVVLFDGEEEPPNCLQDIDFIHCALRGSKAYSKRHAADTQDMVLLDYIAQKANLTFPREAASNYDLWQRLRSAASAVGVGALFPDTVASYSIIDDHTFFARRGVPAIDIIDFDYPPRDGLGDTLDKVSERSLDAVGEAVYELASRLRRRG